jgi:hypothetical protein
MVCSSALPCAHWIEVDVIANALDIAIAAAIDDEGFVTPGKHMAEFPVATVKAAGAGAQQPLHASHKVGLRRLDEQMKVIRYQRACHFNQPAIRKMSTSVEY